MTDEPLNLPWSISPMYADEQEVLIIDAAGDDVVWADRDHAALLVRAVNYSDALVETLRIYVDLDDVDSRFRARARELLKRIEG